MTLAQGDPFVVGDIFSFQQAERIKDNWRAAAAPSNPQPGSLWSDSVNEKLFHRQASAYMEIIQSDNFYLSTTAAGGFCLRIDAYQDDVTALTGLLRGAYIQASNGDIISTGTIRALELKARAGRPGEVGNDVAVLEGLSISADAKVYDITTVMRGAEVILDGAAGASIVKAVGIRIAQNFQADIATLCYGLEIYRDSFDYDADIALSSGGLIGGNAGHLRLDADGVISLYDENKAYRSLIIQSIAEGVSGADLRIGLDETTRRLIICDREDIATDFGLNADGEPSLYMFNKQADYYTYYRYGKILSNGSLIIQANWNLTLRGGYLGFFAELWQDMAAGNYFDFTSSANIGLTDTNAEQAWIYIEPKINQGATAGYIALLIDVTETNLGSGINALLDLRIATATKFKIDNSGGIFPAGMKSGTDQANAGAAAGELYIDTNDDNTIKIGV